MVAVAVATASTPSGTLAAGFSSACMALCPLGNFTVSGASGGG